LRVSIGCAEVVVFIEATRAKDEELRRFGDPSSNAQAMAPKRTAAKFGRAFYLYQK
jgi:hypothetical protein